MQMKQFTKMMSFLILTAGIMAPGSLLAQKEKDKEKKEGEQIIITRKGKSDDKVVVEVVGDKVIVNGKELKDNEDGDVTVRRHKIKDVWAFGGGNQARAWSGDGDHFKIFEMDENKAMLGVSTEQADKGAEVQNVTEGSAAEKAGLKEGDVITKVGDSKIENPDDLSKAIKAKKPGDKVSVTFLRDGKQQSVTAELTKWKGVNVFTTVPDMKNFKMDLGDFAPRAQTIPRVYSTPRMNWSWSGNGPKLGISVQDTEDGKGVNVIEVDEDGNPAKAAIKEDDVITEVDGKAVNSADEIAKLMREGKDKVSVKVKLLRKGKAENVEVKIPRKLKTADL